MADAKARGLAAATIQKPEHIFKKQLLSFAEPHRIVFLRDVNVRNIVPTDYFPAHEYRRIVSDLATKFMERLQGVNADSEFVYRVESADVSMPSPARCTGCAGLRDRTIVHRRDAVRDACEFGESGRHRTIQSATCC
ncbi:MAG: hypothetical protein ACRD3N_08445 [Terracidiphilus sp.]